MESSHPNPASEPSKAPPSPLEQIKADSHFLRGRIAEELAESTDRFSDTTAQIVKHHGMYQQDNRDRRRMLGDPARGSERVYSILVRTAVPGGRLSSEQLLAHLDLCDELGNGTLRITSRQDLQLHGVPKRSVAQVVARINAAGLTTLAACGDVRRNVMCCPAPYYGDPVHGQMQWMAHRLMTELAPRVPSYPEIWLGKTAKTGTGSDLAKADTTRTGGGEVPVPVFTQAAGSESEPLYGPTYLPRKFKVAVGLPGDNCVDLLSQDVGLLAICEDFNIVGYNVLVGGGMGMTPSRKATFAALAQPMAFVPVDQTVDVVTAILRVFRDHGNRSDRKLARLKYLLADWGMKRFKAAVEQSLGRELPAARPQEVWDLDDHLGWHDQGDGRWFFGLYVESGRICDGGERRLKSAVREICRKYQPAVGLTPGKALLFCDIRWEDLHGVEDLLRRHGVRMTDDLSNLRRWSTACVALPTCPLAIAEAERALPGIVEQIEAELVRLELDRELVSLRMSGCSNGCARPYNADIGLVGRSPGRYAIYFGGRRLGNRLGAVYRDAVPLEQIVATLSPVLAYFKRARQPGETFGDFCHRKGCEDLASN